MKYLIEHAFTVGSPVLALALLCQLSTGCDEAEEASDNFDSSVTCFDYCEKKFACDEYEPTSSETDSCISDCRNAIENECGNDSQEAANDKIEECVDKSCVDFWSCMTFDTAPECFSFVDL